tara:strand:- start:648 stop:2126 length:1479 start_codon:yes stop_codon:yes gene_type:complete
MPIDFQLISKDGGLTNRGIANWTRGAGGFTASFDVKHRIDKGTFTQFNTTSTSVAVDGISPGSTFEVQVRAVGIGFPVKKSTFAKVTAVAPALPDLGTDDDGKPITQVVPNVSNLSLSPINDTQGLLKWNPPANEKLNNLVVLIRHSSKTDGTGTFTNAVKLAEVQATANSVAVPLMNGEYIIKLQDQTTKVKSATAISLVLNIPSAIPKLLVQTRREDTDTPPFQGEKFGCFYSDEYDGLVLDGSDTIDDVVLIDDLSEMDFIGERLASGEYEFPALLDLGGKFQAELDRTINSRGLYPSDLIDDRSELVDAWSDWDGTLAEDTNAILYFRSSNEAPAADDILLEATPDFFLLEDGDKLLQESSTEFGDWRVLEKSTFVGRTFQFKCELEAEHPDQTPLVEELGYQLSIPARTESSATIASGAAAKAVTFTNAFYQAPTVGVTAFNLASGDYYEVTSVTRTGFTVHFKNSSNSSIDRNFQYVAAGFGSEQT